MGDSHFVEAGFFRLPNSGIWAVKFCLLVSLAVLLSGASLFARTKDSQFLWISDIHFNPMSDPSLVRELQNTDPAKWESVLERTSPDGYSQYKSDTNWWLLRSALEQFPKTLPHPAFVVLTGDLLAHDFPGMYRDSTRDENQQHYREFVLKTMQFLALELQHKFPQAKIFITPGNNDNDCGNYSVQAGGTFLHDTESVARMLAGAEGEFTNTWTALGSFNVPHPTVKATRMLSLNSIFWSQKYVALSSREGCKPVQSTAPEDLMQWLAEQLAAAAQANQKVWLMFHIPPGIDGYSTAMNREKLEAASTSTDSCAESIVPMWTPHWTEQFDGLLGKYHATVTAVLAAHTHSDDFRLFAAAEGEHPYLVMAPAISPVYEQNPSFRVATYSKDGVLSDQTTYYLTNLPEASKKKKGLWKKEYTFTKQWKAQKLDAESLSRLYDNVVANPAVREEWLNLYAVSGPALQGEKPIVKALYCAVEGLSVESYRQCYCGK
jgi:hypothetical protein